MRIVTALGGNALLRHGDPMATEVQERNIRIAADAIASLAAGHSVVVVHGNGPQVGLLSLQAESYADAEPYPLDVLDAGTQGMIGDLIQQEPGACRPVRAVARRRAATDDRNRNLARARRHQHLGGAARRCGAGANRRSLRRGHDGRPAGAGHAVAVITVTVLLSVVAHGVTAEPLATRYASRLARPADGRAGTSMPGVPDRSLIRRSSPFQG